MTPDRVGPSIRPDEPVAVDELERIAAELRLTPQVVDVLRELTTAKGPTGKEIVAATAELASLHEQLSSDVAGASRATYVGRVLEEQAIAYGSKLNEIRTMATLSEDAVSIFRGLLRCGDPRLEHAALLGIGREFAKQLQPELNRLAGAREQSPFVRRQALALVTDGDAEV
jgi:hypothetical protein